MQNMTHCVWTHSYYLEQVNNYQHVDICAICFRPNIYLDVKHVNNEPEDCLAWLVKILKEGPQVPKIIIYTRYVSVAFEFQSNRL